MSIGKILLFRNPSTGDSIKLPPNNLAKHYEVLSFSAQPTSPDCVVFGLFASWPYNICSMTFIRRGDRSWHHSNNSNRAMLDAERDRLVARHHISSSRKRVIVHQGNQRKFRPGPCKAHFKWSNHQSAPVFHNGAFYCLSQEGRGGRGRLGIFDPTKKKRKNMWRILDVGSCHNFLPTSNVSQSYLMESSRGELISVYVGEYGEFVRVFKLDEDLKLWQSVCSLGDQVAFLSPTSSMVISCRELQVKGLENTVHFARFDDEGNYNIFYSLSTQKFHSFKNGYTSNDLFDTQFYLNSTWIVPDFRSFSRQWMDSSLEDNDTIVVNNASHYVCNSTFSRLSNKIATKQVVAPVGRPLIILSRGEYKLEAWEFVDLVNGRGRMESSFRGEQVYGGTNGRVVVMDFESRDCALLNTSTMAMEPLPTWPVPMSPSFDCIVYEWDSKYAVTIFGNFGKLFKCRVGDEEWTTHEKGPQVCEVVAYQGMLYGIEYGGDELFKMEEYLEEEKDWRVEVVETVERPSYRPMGTEDETEYLVESCGEILLFKVLWSYCFSNVEIILEVRAYKLDSKEKKWKEVKDLGDRTFFISNDTKGFGCCASGSGFPRNNIYFVMCDGDNVVRYNYGDHSIRTVLTCKEGCEILGFVMG
ncbi:F-box protein At2g17036 [Linum grandiflorum]